MQVAEKRHLQLALEELELEVDELKQTVKRLRREKAAVQNALDVRAAPRPA